jgi:tetratricopeptide (TPR) repeat protein
MKTALGRCALLRALWSALLIAWAAAAAAQTSGAEARAVQDLLARGQAEAALQRLDAKLGETAGAAPTGGSATSAGSPPVDAELRFLRGVALMDLGRNAEALAWFERMTQDHPELPDPFNNIALLQVRAGRLEPARQALEAALRNDPSYRLARANLGLVYLMLAVQAWDQVLASGPVDPQLARRLEGARALLASATGR